MNVEELIQKIDDQLCEEYWPRAKADKWIEIAKIFESQGNQKGVDEAKLELNLLNYAYLAPPDAITDVWKWCIENINKPFSSWKCEAIEYYGRRLKETKNPLHRARYSYALWTLKRDVECAKTSIDSFSEAGKQFIAKKCYSEGACYITNAFCFEFAGKLSLALNYPNMFLEVASTLFSAVIELQKEKIKGRGTCDFIHTMVLLLQSAISNSSVNKNGTLLELVKKTWAVSAEMATEWYKEGNFHWQRSYLEDCIIFARFLGDHEMARKLLVNIAETYVKEGESRSGTKMVEEHFYHLALRIYANLGMPEKIEELKKKISNCERQAEEKGEYKTVKVAVDIPIDKIAENYVKQYGNNAKELLAGITNDPRLVPSKKQVLERVKSIRKDYPLQFILPTSLMGRDGPIETFNTEEEIFEYKLREQYNLEAQVSEQVLKNIFGLLQNQLRAHDFVAYITSGRNISDNAKKIIESGLKAHFDCNYVCSISVIVPQMEEVIRDLLRNNGITPTKYEPTKGGIEQTLLGTIIDEAEPILGEDFAEYLRIRLTSRFANIRNEVCHGWMPIEDFRESLSIALIFMLLKICNA